MKQSKKLLSIFLAMLMLLGTVSVIGNAGYQKAQMGYDSVDNPAPTADQVANLVLDVLDELLKEMDFNENYYVVKINLTSVDNAIATLGSFNGIKGIAGGDIANLDLDAVRKDNQTTFLFHHFLQSKYSIFDKLNIEKNGMLLYNKFVHLKNKRVVIK